MNPLALLVAVVIATGFVLTLGIVAVAAGRGPDLGRPTLSEFTQPSTVRQPRSQRGGVGATPTESPTGPELEPEPHGITDGFGHIG